MCAQSETVFSSPPQILIKCMQSEEREENRGGLGVRALKGRLRRSTVTLMCRDAVLLNCMGRHSQKDVQSKMCRNADLTLRTRLLRELWEQKRSWAHRLYRGEQKDPKFIPYLMLSEDRKRFQKASWGSQT